MFYPDALKYEEKTSVKRTKITESVGSAWREEVTQEQQIIQLFCRHLIIMAHSPFIEGNLYALVQFMIFLSSLNYRVEDNYPRVESLFTSLVKELIDGQIYQKRKAITTHTGQTPLQIFFTGSDAAFFHHHGGDRVNTYSPRLGDTMQFLVCKTKRCKRICPRIGNYWIQFYHSTFGLKDLTHSLRTLYYYFIDFFYLKTLLSVQSARGHAVSEEAIQHTFSHYATVTMHSTHFRPQLGALIDKLNYGDDLSCLLLLN